MMTKLLDSRNLADAGREIGFPFTVCIETGDGPVTLMAERALRILPGKRLVCAGKLVPAEKPVCSEEPASGIKTVCSEATLSAEKSENTEKMMISEQPERAGNPVGAEEPLCSGEPLCVERVDGRAVVVKFFLDPKGAGRHFRREENGCRALAAAGIPTPAIVFSGTLAEGGAKVLAFDEVRGAKDMAQAWDEAAGDDIRVALQLRAIAAISAQHAGGLTQNDLHLGNFLLADGELYTIDGDAVDTAGAGKPLSRRTSIDNLGLFFAQFYPRYDGFIAAAFESYASLRGWRIGEADHVLLREALRRQRERRRDKFLSKIFRECTAFVCRKEKRKRWVCARSFHDESMAEFIADPDGFIAGGRILKGGNTATVAEVSVGGRRLVVKRYNIKNFRHGVRRCLRESRARISWRNAHRLSQLGIGTPKPVLFMEERLGPLPGRAWFVTEYLDGPDLWHLLHSERRKGIDLPGLADQVEVLLRQLAEARISHGDFKGTNFIPGEGKLFLIDLDAMKQHRRPMLFQRAFQRDLRRFAKNWKDLPGIAKLFGQRIAGVKY